MGLLGEEAGRSERTRERVGGLVFIFFSSLGVKIVWARTTTVYLRTGRPSFGKYICASKSIIQLNRTV